jgi:hypothetical protein
MVRRNRVLGDFYASALFAYHFIAPACGLRSLGGESSTILNEFKVFDGGMGFARGFEEPLTHAKA